MDLQYKFFKLIEFFNTQIGNFKSKIYITHIFYNNLSNKIIINKMEQQDDKNQEEMQKKHLSLLYKISYLDDPQSSQPRKYRYSSDTLIPFLYFYKLLALKPCDRYHKSNKLILNIPDTVIFNDGDNPVMWLYTNSKGQVTRVDNIPYFQITSKLAQGALDKQLVVVQKKPSYGYGGPSGNDVKTVTASELKNVLSMILGHRNEISVLQKFIKSCSNRPSIVRTCWRVKGPCQSYVLNSSYSYTSNAKVPQINKLIVNTKVPHAFKATKSVSTKFTNETLKYVKNIVDFVGRNLKINFEQFVADFVKDQGGNWWFINVKAFIIEGQQKKINTKPIVGHDHDDIEQQEKNKKNLESYTKCKKCKYCQKVIAEHLMTHKLTLMMILQCDQHLIKIGKSFSWLDRCYKQHVSSVNLYVEHKVCQSCYKLYIEVQKLIELDKKMAKVVGFSTKADNKNLMSITAVPSFKGYSPQFGSRFQKIKYDTQMPKNWGLPKDQQIVVGLEDSGSKMVNRCRIMLYVHGLRDIPTHFGDLNEQFWIQYKFLGQKVRYKIDLSKSEQFESMLKIMVDKMKMFYFFSESREDIIKFIKQEQVIKVSLYRNTQFMGNLQLELDDFKSDKVIKKDYYKMFSGPKIFPYLSWGLFISVGLYQGAKVGTNTLKLTRKKNLLLPQYGYHCPQTLPQQWIQMIIDKPDRQIAKNSRISQSQDRRSIKTFSEISMKQRMKMQVSNYSKRRAVSQYKVKRKPHYS